MNYRKFACVVSHDSRYCGPAALATVALHYGLHISTVRLGELLGTDLQGTDLASLQRGAESLGFSASTGKVKTERLEHLPLPAIAHFNDSESGHIVVIHKLNKQSLVIADPSRGVISISREDFLRRWSRHVVLLAPTAFFRVNKKPDSSLWDFVAIARNEKKTILSSIFISVAIVIAAFGFSAFAQFTLDRVIPHSDLKLLYLLSLAVSAAIAFRSFGGLAREYLLAGFGLRLELSLGAKYTDRLLALPLEFYEKRSAGEVFARMTDISNVRNAIVGTLLSVLLDFSLLVLCTIFLLWYSAILGFVVLLVVPIVGILMVIVNRRLIVKEREIREHLTQLATRFIEIVQNIRSVKMFTSEPQAHDQIMKKYTEAQKSTSERLILSNSAGQASTFITSLAAVVILMVGARLAIQGRLTVGQLMFFYSAFGLLLGSVERLAPSIASLQEATIGMERLKTVEFIEPEKNLRSGHIQNIQFRGGVQFQDVSFWRREKYPALSHINLEINAGESIAIVGETGSGKSTLAYLVAGLYQPKGGDILFDGQSIQDIDKTSLRKHVAAVFQDPGLMSGTIRTNIALGNPTASFEMIQEAAKLAQAHDFILKLPRGYEYEVGAGGVALSSGQRQRIAIARAILRDPAILILDEATGNLDTETERKVMEAIQKTRQNRTTLISTHRLSIAVLAQRAVILDAGTIAEEGTHAELIAKRGKYFSLWKAYMTDESVSFSGKGGCSDIPGLRSKQSVMEMAEPE